MDAGCNDLRVFGSARLRRSGSGTSDSKSKMKTFP